MNSINTYLENLNMFIDFREGKEEREREMKKNQCERETSIGCFSYAARLGVKPTT